MNFRLDYEKHKLYIFGSVPALVGLLLLLNWWETKDWLDYSITARSFGLGEAKELSFVSTSPPLRFNFGGMDGEGGTRHTFGFARFSDHRARPLLRSLVLTWEANGQLFEVKMEIPPPSPEVFKRVHDHYGFQVNEKFVSNRLELILEVDPDHQRAWGYWQEVFWGGPSYRHEDPREDEWWPARVLPLPVKPVREPDPLEVDLYNGSFPKPAAPTESAEPMDEPEPRDRATDH